MRVGLKSCKGVFEGGRKKGVGAENEMGWRGKYRDSLGSLRRPEKKETPKVSGGQPRVA